MPRKVILRKIEINEISGVDNPAQEGARMVIMKRADGKTEKGAGDLADLLTSEEEGHQHGINFSVYDSELSIYVSYASGTGEDDTGHYHSIVRNADGTYTLAVVAGHTHTVDQGDMSAAVLALLSKNKKEGDDMFTDPKPTDPKGMEKELKDAQDGLKVANAVIALKPGERTHFDKLDEEGKKNFLAKSGDQRASEMEAAEKADADADPVVYTTMDGVELRKSAGAALLAMAKSNDAIRKENKELRDQSAQDALEKRAEVELEFMPGDLPTRAAMLKAIDGIEDKSQREAAHNSLKAQNQSMSEAFTTHGHGGQPEDGSADDDLDKLSKAYSKEHNVTEAVAYSKVLETPKGKELYSKTVN